MIVSHAIMAHPKRARFVDELVVQMPGAQVVWDEHNDRWDTGRRSMLAYDPAADFHCVTQDDAVLCRDFVPGVERALAAVGDHPAAFYTGKVRPHADQVRRMVRAAVRSGQAWIAAPGPWWGVSVAVPTSRIEAMIEWGDRHPSIENYDRRLAGYFKRERIDCWYSVPSLVDHRVGDENPSLVPGRGNSRARTAHVFIGDGSPLDVEWEPKRKVS